MILKVENLNAYYGKSHVLKDLNFSIKKGEVSFIIGRNGVGKSTTLLSVMGLMEKIIGSILYKDIDILGMEPYEISRMGIGLVPETRRIISGLTVEENLLIAAQAKEGWWSLDKIYSLFPILSERKKQEGVTLSGGEQQILTIARTLMGNPEIILIDEPTEGLAPLIVKSVKEQLMAMKEHGVTMIICDSSLSLAKEIGGGVFLMEKGEIKWSGTVEDLVEDETTINKYLAV